MEEWYSVNKRWIRLLLLEGKVRLLLLLRHMEN